LAKFKAFLKKVLPTPIYSFLRLFRNWNDFPSSISFLLDDIPNVSLKDKIRIVKQLNYISLNVDSPHTQVEMLTFIRTILSLPPERNGVVVEAGCFKGSSTAKFSLATDIVGRKLVVFDSFEGIPENDEPHEKDIFGENASFKKGDYRGTLEEVRANVTRFGKINGCRFIQGWFENTMSDFKDSISAIYLDVDLASSTRTCLKHLFPLLGKGGILYSQDGHLPLVIDVFSDDDFWLKEVGCKRPSIQGLGKKKLIRIIKEA
jgi:O-methyltransferase